MEKKEFKIITLGGVDEIGKNLTVIECNHEILIIDCGSMFPENELLGINLIVPGMEYLEVNKSMIKGLVITHGHEDHIGGIPYFLSKISTDIPIYCGKYASALISNKIIQAGLTFKHLNIKKAGDKFKIGTSFNLEFIHVNHSILDSFAVAIKTPYGTIMHTGDFKIDETPVNNQATTDLKRFEYYGKAGVKLLMCESTNAEKPGHSISEKTVSDSFDVILKNNKKKRIIIATFASNTNRLQSIVDLAAKYKRKVAIVGRSMKQSVEICLEIGYIKDDNNVIIDIGNINNYSNEELLIISTGSQGEIMSALQRMSVDEFRDITLTSSDVVVFSSKPVPGNEKLVGNIINSLIKKNIDVIKEPECSVHASGHACQEELSLLQSLVNPEYLIPIHGEARHLYANKKLAIAHGMDETNIIIPHIGSSITFDENGMKEDKFDALSGVVMIDNNGEPEVEDYIIKERSILSKFGVIAIAIIINKRRQIVIGEPDFASKGFVKIKEAVDLIPEIKKISKYACELSISQNNACVIKDMKKCVKDSVNKYIQTKTCKSPMVVPIIINV